MTRILSIVLAFFCTSAALGGSIERAWVDPEASWAAHLDIEGILGSPALLQLTQALGVDLAEIEREARLELDEIDLEDIEDADVPPQVLEAWRNLDFSLTRDLKSVTLFGTGVGEEPDVVILRTTDAVDGLVATLDPIQGINVVEGEAMSFVALREPGQPAGPGGEEAVAAIRKHPFSHDRTVVIADSTAGLIESLELYSRQAAAGPDGGPAWATLRPGSYMFVHVTGEGLQMLDGQASEILGRAKEVHLEAGESAGDVYMEAFVETENAETVNNLVAMANGLLALGRLGLASEPEGQALIPLINAVRITTQDSAMVVEFRMAAQALAETIQRLKEMEEEEEEWDEDAEEEEEARREVEIRIGVGSESDSL